MFFFWPMPFRASSNIAFYLGVHSYVHFPMRHPAGVNRRTPVYAFLFHLIRQPHYKRLALALNRFELGRNVDRAKRDNFMASKKKEREITVRLW